MDPDLFSPADTAALLAIRTVLADRLLCPDELRALFDASGLIRAHGAERRAGMPSVLPASNGPSVPDSRRAQR